MTYASDTTDKDALDQVWVVTVEGLYRAFVHELVAAALLTGKTQTACLERVPSFGEERLDLDQRCVTGGGCTITLQDTDDEVLLATFKPRARASAYLTASVLRSEVMSGAGVVSVSSTAGFPTLGAERRVFHIGSEAFTYTGLTSTTFTGVTRAAHDTTEQDHFGGAAADAGAAVTSYPQAWTGRRVTVKAGYKRADGTYRLDDVPQPGVGDEWVMSCSPLSDRFREARCYVGLRDVQDLGIDGGSGVFGGSFEAATYGELEQFAVGGAPSHVLVTTNVGDVYSLRPLVSVFGTTLTVNWPEQLKPSPGDLVAAGTQVVARQLRHVALLRGHPVGLLLALLTSIEGDGVNGVNDLLPGLTRGAYGGPQWQFGAGIPEDEINDDGGMAVPGEGSIYALMGGAVEWTHLLCETLEGGEILREFCIATGSYWYVDSQGRLSFGRMRDSAPPSLTVQGPEIDDDSALFDADGQVRATEHRAVHTVRMLCNYQPIVGEHTVRVSVTDWETRNKFREAAKEVEIESKFFHVDARPYALAGGAQRIEVGTLGTPEQVASALRRALLERGRAEAIVTESCAWDASLLRVGQFVELGNSRLPDLEGGRLTSARALIVGRRLDPESASVDLTMRVVDSANLIAPCGVIATLDTNEDANDIWTVDPLDPTADPALDSPVDAFAETNTIEWYCHADGQVYEQTIAEITSSSHKIILGEAPQATPSAGDYFWPKIGSSSVESAAGYNEDDFAAMQAAGGSDPTTRWS